jgi:serine/threonine-protein kinase
MSHPSLINKLISDYRILDLIGKGGMGTVYRAMHTKTGQMAAIKVLHHPGMSDRFINEAKVHARLKHTNIARMYGYDIYDSRPCIIMELIDGKTLLEIMNSEKKLSVERSLKYFIQLCSAISWLHNNDIMYRDIKPENIKIDSEDNIKLLDFGIAKSNFSPNLTQTGFTVGTIDYMAPEQLQGNSVKASDVWSLGVILYQMLSGCLPFQADTYINTQVNIVSGKYIPVSYYLNNKWRNLDMLIRKCLKPNPGKRASCNKLIELSHELKDFNLEKKANSKLKTKRDHQYQKAFWLIPIILVLGILFRVSSERINEGSNANENQRSSHVDSIKIDVLNANDARIVFPDHTSYPVPYSIVGRTEEQTTFKITAPGYEDKNVTIDLDQRRKSFDYVLEKKRK